MLEKLIHQSDSQKVEL